MLQRNCLFQWCARFNFDWFTKFCWAIPALFDIFGLGRLTKDRPCRNAISEKGEEKCNKRAGEEKRITLLPKESVQYRVVADSPTARNVQSIPCPVTGKKRSRELVWWKVDDKNQNVRRERKHQKVDPAADPVKNVWGCVVYSVVFLQFENAIVIDSWKCSGIT